VAITVDGGIAKSEECCIPAIRRPLLRPTESISDQASWLQSWGLAGYRLFHAGVSCRNIWFAGLQAHLYHNQVKRPDLDRRDEELVRVHEERRTRALRGFSQMDQEGRILTGSDK